MYYEWRPHVSAAERRRKAEREMQRLRKKGHPVAPVMIAGRTIAKTFWGKAWCNNLERYSDFSNRLPRGRTHGQSDRRPWEAVARHEDRDAENRRDNADG